MEHAEDTLAGWFGLRDSKPDFEIQAREDADQFYCRDELKGELHGILNAAFRSPRHPARFVIYGDWGCGKTHTLRHLKYTIDQDETRHATVVYRELPDLKTNATFQVGHAALLDALGSKTVVTWMEQLNRQGVDLQKTILDWSGNEAIAKAFMTLAVQGAWRAAGWSWLRGSKVDAATARGSNLALEALEQSDDLVSVLKVLGQLSREIDGKALIFMVDEVAKLANVTSPDAVMHWTNALKLICDQENPHFGMIFAGSYQDLEDFPLPMRDEQIVSRIGLRNFHVMPGFDEGDCTKYLTDLFAAFIDEGRRDSKIEQYGSESEGETLTPEYFPFTKEGVEELVKRATRNGAYCQPRDLLDELHRILNKAMDKEQHVLSGKFLQEVWGGGTFGG
jgi:Cdc6-like AAA superfamily ATPase